MGYKTYNCPIERSCGGCELLAVPYPIQLKRKQASIESLFSSMLAEDDTELDEIRGMNIPLAYRYKAATPFAPAKGGHIRSGFYKAGTHRIVSCDACLVEASGLREALSCVARAAEAASIRAYNEDRGTGLLRHAVVRKAYNPPSGSDELLMSIVTNGQTLKQKRLFVQKLCENSPKITSLVQNINQKNTNAIFGTESITLTGPGYIHDRLLGCIFEIGPTSFYQTNPAQTEVLYQLVLEALDATESAGSQELRVLDAYCGCGTIGICAAAHNKKLHVVGVEKGAEAITYAHTNAKLNKLKDRTRFIQADATSWIQGAIKKNDRFDAVILDPPRAGSTIQFMQAVCALNPQTVVYVSCNPTTQVRDLSVLRQGGYRLQRISPVDMFPHTKHLETVAIITRSR